jgi:signal peptidase
MKILLNTTYAAAIGVLCLIALFFVATLLPIPGNVKVKVVKSGSMEPFMQVGGIVVIKPAPTYTVGDVITFGADTTTQIPTTHRIVEATGEGSNVAFTTKGDANDSADPSPTHPQDIEGKVLLSIPYIGYVLAFLRTKLGFILLVGLPAAAIFLEEGYAIYREIMRGRKRNKKVSVMQEVEVLKPREPRRYSDIRPKVLGLVVLLGAMGCAALGGTYGSTLAFYANSATSHGNIMRAGIFPVEETIAIILSAAVVNVVDPEGDPGEAPPLEDGATQVETDDTRAPQEDVEAPVVEISEPVVEVIESTDN